MFGKFTFGVRVFGAGVLFWLLVGGLASGESKDWREWRKSDRIAVAVSRAKLGPARRVILYSKGTSQIHVLREEGALLEKDEVWAVSDPERLELDSATLKMEEEALQIRLDEMEFEHEEKLAQFRKNLAKLKLERSRLELMKTEEDVVKEERLRERVEEALKSTDEEMARLQKRIGSAEAGLSLESEQKRARLELRRRQLDFEKARSASEYQAPFAGRLEFMGPLALESEVVPRLVNLQVGEAIATIVDDRHYEVLVQPIVGGAGRGRRKELFLEIDGQIDSRRIRATYSRTEVQTQNQMLPESWVFRVVEEDVPKAKVRQGRQILATVYRQLGKECRIVPKAELIKDLPDAARTRRWADAVRQVWPGAYLVAEGQDALALAEIPEEETAKTGEE